MAGTIAFPVRAPQWVLTYQGVNITANISQMVTSITYLDRLAVLPERLKLPWKIMKSDGRDPGSPWKATKSI